MEQTKKTRKRVARWLIPLFILLAIISYPLLFGKVGLHARYKIENDAVVISSVIVDPTFKMYGWSFPSICDPNKDPDIMVNGKRYYIIIDPMGHRFMCAQAYTTIHTTIVEPVPLNDISIPLQRFKRRRERYRNILWRRR